MRNLLLGAAAIALSGCSWLGGSKTYDTNYGSQDGYYTGTQQKSDACCVGGKRLARWNVEAAVGPEYFLSGDAITGDQTNIIPGVESRNVSIDSAFDEGLRYELGGSYALSPNRKVTLLGNYAKHDGNNVSLGAIDGSAVTGQFSDYERYGAELGLRQYFSPTKAPIFGSVRPYVEGRVGANYVDDIALNNVQQNGAVYNDGTIRMYESGWVPTAAGLVGVEAPVFNRATLGLETGLRYTGVMKSDTSDLNSGVPFGGINNGMDSLSVPVMLRGRYRF